MGGALTAVAARAAIDYNTGTVSSLGTYVGAGVSGAIGGIALLGGGGLGTAIAVGAGAGAVGNVVEQGIDSGWQDINTRAVVAATAAGGFTAGLLKPFAGFFEAQYAPTARGILTKYLGGTIRGARPSTLAKTYLARMLDDNTVPASFLEAFLSLLFDPSHGNTACREN